MYVFFVFVLYNMLVIIMVIIMVIFIIVYFLRKKIIRNKKNYKGDLIFFSEDYLKGGK